MTKELAMLTGTIYVKRETGMNKHLAGFFTHTHTRFYKFRTSKKLQQNNPDLNEGKGKLNMQHIKYAI